MTFTLAETLWLHSLGFDDLLLAYPTTDMGALAELGALEDDGRPIVMVDSADAPGPDRARRALPRRARSACAWTWTRASTWRAAGVKIGPKRSPVRTPPQAVALAREVVARPGFELAGLMAYEGHIAGVGDQPARQPAAGPGDPAGCRRRRRASWPSAAPRWSSAVSGDRAAGAGQRRRHRQPAHHLARAGGDRADRRLGLLRPHAVRPLLRLHAAPRRGLRPAGGAPARARTR